jgi:hypothetical protein
MRGRVARLLLAAASLAPGDAAPCTASANHVCVSHSAADAGLPYDFLVDLGPGPVPRAELAVSQGSTLTFELDATSDFGSHPFVLTTRPDGGPGSPELGVSDGLTGTNPATANGAILVFTPTQPGRYYYDCALHYREGAAVVVAPGTPPDSGQTGHDAGSGPPDSGNVSPPDAGPALDSGASDSGSRPPPDAGPGSGGGDGGPPPPARGCGCANEPGADGLPLFGALAGALWVSARVRRRA